ncbi:CBS domain-containing protein [Streptomyces sp. 7N604]|uniref:CBS domain-containing protein n=1 Tax=Streptomyces sp. 7N604 TaxID=3457415 RepID=UPI003FD3AEAF
MLARDLAEPYPFVSADSDALDAVRLVARQKLPALLVVDADEQPYAVLPGSQVAAALIPEYVVKDPAQAAVLDEQQAYRPPEMLADLSVAEWLPKGRAVPPVIGPDSTVLQAAALMARCRSPLVPVVEHDGTRARVIGAITAARLLDHLMGLS